MLNSEPRKLSVLLGICLHTETPGGLHYGVCTVASDLEYRGIISREETRIVKGECMKLVSETRLQGDIYGYVCLLRSALRQRLRGNHIDLDDMCYLIYSCWIDKLESEGK